MLRLIIILLLFAVAVIGSYVTGRIHAYEDFSDMIDDVAEAFPEEEGNI